MFFMKIWFLFVAVFFALGCSSRNGVVDFGDGRYEGNLDKDGRRHGEGIYEWNNGDRYEGQFRNGKRHGKGNFVWANGDRYEGEYRNGKRHNRGSYEWINGARYDGQYAFGKRHGRGTFASANGSRYDGWWRDDREDGHGILSYPDGRQIEGKWSRGQLETETTIIENNTSTIAPVPVLPTIPIPSQPAIPIPSQPATEETKEPTAIHWKGTQEQAEAFLELREVGEISTLHIKETGEPFVGTITIVLEDGSRQGRVTVVDGLLHGEEILWGEDGEILERNRYENGELFAEEIVPPRE